MNKLSVESNIVLELKRRIFDGEYIDDSAMPSQRQLTKEFQTSLSTISKALNKVKEHGLIELLPGRSARVLPLDERDQKGAIVIIYHGASDIKPVEHEPALIINGIITTLTNKCQHYRLMGTENIDMNNTDEQFKYFSGAICIESTASKMEKLIEGFKKKDFPYVVSNLEKDAEYTSTWIDHKKTTTVAVEVMTAFGHKRIALLIKDLDSYFYRSALEGYKQGLKNAKIEFDENFIIKVQKTGGSELAYTAMKHYLNNNQPPTAIIVSRDYLAAGVWQAITERGLNVGRDVSIIGFDNLSWPAGKNLTTFDEPAIELGTVAAEMIIDQITYGLKPIEKRELEAPLILRSSVGPCQEQNVNSIPLKLYKSV